MAQKRIADRPLKTKRAKPATKTPPEDPSRLPVLKVSMTSTTGDILIDRDSDEGQLSRYYRAMDEDFKQATLDIARWGYLATLAIEETQSAQASETPASA